MKLLLLMLAVALSACATSYSLPYTSASAPQWQMNPDLVGIGANAITTPPTMPVGIGPR